MRLDIDGRYCWSVVDEAMLAESGADGEDTEEIGPAPARQEGVDVAALFKAYDGEMRVSLRSSGRVNVQEAAKRLGGGGHFARGRPDVHGTLDEAIAARCTRRCVAEGL